MGISSVKTIETGYDVALAVNSGNQSVSEQTTEAAMFGDAAAYSLAQVAQSPAVKNEIAGGKRTGKQDIEYVSAEMNKFMELMEAGIRFKLHQKTGRLMVEVVDIQKNKVLKELPPHEMLDTIAKIRDYVGFILDKKA